MDLNDKIAARREDLARLEKEAATDRDAAKARAVAAETKQQEAAAVALAEEVNAADDVEVVAKGTEVEFVPVPDLTGWSPDMKAAALERLFHREARKLWSPKDQWLVISLVAGGVCLIHLAGFGLVLILAGLGFRVGINRRCRERLRDEHPDLFGAVPVR